MALSRPSSAPDGAGVGAGPGAGGPLVAAAGLLAAAEEALAEAEGGLEAAEGRQRAGDAAAADLEAAGRIASSLRAELQRRRSGLRRRCAAAVDGSVRIGPEGMAAGPDAAKLSEAGGRRGGRNRWGDRPPPPPPPGRDSLGDAHGALALLPGRGLDDALRALGRNLTGLVLGSFLDAHVASAGAGSVPPRLLLHKSERRGGLGRRRGGARAPLVQTGRSRRWRPRSDPGRRGLEPPPRRDPARPHVRARAHPAGPGRPLPPPGPGPFRRGPHPPRPRPPPIETPCSDHPPSPRPRARPLSSTRW